MGDLRISVCMPVYNAAKWINASLDCILEQSFKDLEVVICDDSSKDNSCDVIEAVGDPRIRLFRGERLGYPGNLQRCIGKAHHEIIFLMGQDDLICDGLFQRIHDIFADHPEVGALTRAYFWFQGDIQEAVRVKPPADFDGDAILSLADADPEQVLRAFHSMDQLSGLAMRREWIDMPVHEHIFTAHVYPMASIWTKHRLYCMRENTIAVRIESSQSRSLKSIYNPSPVWTWVRMFETVLHEPEFADIRRYLIRNMVAKNYVGLVQIRNFGAYSWLLREIWMLLKYRWQNVFSPSFWFFSLGCMLMPPSLLLPMVDSYKRKVLSKAVGIAEFHCAKHWHP